MQRPISAYGFSQVMLRFTGLMLLGWWVYDWVQEVLPVAREGLNGNWTYVRNMWANSIVPRSFRLGAFWQPYNINPLLRLVVGAYLLFGGRWLARLLSRNAEIAGCAKCGYSLQGLKGDRCPECGEPIQRHPPPSA